MLAVAAHPLMRGDALALEEDFHRPRRDPCFDRLAGEAMRHGVEVVVDIDMVIDADSDGTAAMFAPLMVDDPSEPRPVVGNSIGFGNRFLGALMSAIVFALVFGILVYFGYGSVSMSVTRTPSTTAPAQTQK
jgi:hypothetical protein